MGICSRQQEEQMPRVVAWASTCIQAAFVVLAVTLIAGTSLRTPAALQAFDWLFVLVAAWGCWRSYQRGDLAMTPKAIHRDAKPKRPTSEPLLMVAFYIGIAALAVINLT
jgi:hypothetical protein